jgi:Trk K+ transport system NAD-binding subunit
MRTIPRPYRRLAIMLMSLPALLLALGILYQLGMAFLEGSPRTFGESLEWAAETLTTTGYGRDVRWTHPVMQFFVIFIQFVGVFLVFLIFPIFVIPFFEEHFQARLPTAIPDLAGKVLIYRFGPAVTSLLDELDEAKVPVVIFEEDEAIARRLHDRGRLVVLGNLEEDDPDLSNLVGGRGLVVNGEDDANAAMTLSARYHGFTGPIVALVKNPERRRPMLRAGATTAFTPDHVLAAALASRASVLISPRVAGVRQLGHHLDVAELRVHAASPLVGRTIADCGIRSRTGATIVGLWTGGVLLRQPTVTSRLEMGTILVAVGTQQAIARLSELATPVARGGAFVVVGYGSVGRKVAEFLRDADETVRVVAADGGDGVDIVGDPLSPEILERAGARDAQAVVLTLGTDSATLFAAGVVRNLAADVVIIAGASRVENVSRIHRAGADFALSVGQVAGQLLAYHLLGQESVSLTAGIKIVATAAGSLAGRPLVTSEIQERTGCSVVAVERSEDLIVQFDRSFTVHAGDVVYLSGTNETIAEYFRQFPETQISPVPRRKSLLVDGTETEHRVSPVQPS